MTAVDTNVLVYAHRQHMPRHVEARACLTRLAEGAEPWAVPVFCLGEFVRLITYDRDFARFPEIEVRACAEFTDH